MAGPALAQSLPSPADELLRQQERERVLRERQERAPDVRLPQPEAAQGMEHLPDGEANCIVIERIHLSGDAAEQFQWALADAHRLADGTPDPAVNRCLGSRGVNLLMRRIQNVLIAKGYTLAQVLAGPQAHLSVGTLELSLFPGRIRRIEFAPESSGPRATQWNAFPVQPGDLLNLRDIEQALENFKRVPSVEASIELRAAEGIGAAPGQSDVIIHWKQDFPLRLSLSADDAGTQATGKYQGSVTLAYDHWWTLNDLFYLSLDHDLGKSGAGTGPYGTRGYTAHYAVPMGYWLLGLTTSRHRYHQSVAGASQTYLYSGTSRNGEIRLSRVVHRNTTGKTTAALRGWTRASSNHIDDTEVLVQRRRMAGWAMTLSHRAFIGDATLDTNLDYRRGTGAGESRAAPEEIFGEGTARPQIITADTQLSLPFRQAGQAWIYTGTWRGQWHKTPLVPQDRFAIGGRYSVRGFDGESQLLAERGWLLRNDLAVVLGQSGQAFYVGIDHGQVAGPSSDLLLGKHLSGAVLGLRGTVKNFSYDLFIGKPISKPAGFRTASSVAGFNINAWF
ncbi:putative hemolysin activation/secretion protein [Sterolibacterium denitrificans]|nr:ShlB/FhaC/HecB family hemolysin secretion/activation protein [Sterolibacterium denitrificans]SMB21496.1 putative hemolysin activation/secretion protein [Sterolibacterium denitrificans]